jgi:hypothetical protein
VVDVVSIKACVIFQKIRHAMNFTKDLAYYRTLAYAYVMCVDKCRFM